MPLCPPVQNLCCVPCATHSTYLDQGAQRWCTCCYKRKSSAESSRPQRTTRCMAALVVVETLKGWQIGNGEWRSEVAPCPASEALTRHSPCQVMTIWRMNSESPLWRIWKIILRQSVAMGWMSLKWVFNGQISSRFPVWHDVGPKRPVLPIAWYQSFVLLHLIACGSFLISSMPDS